MYQDHHAKLFKMSKVHADNRWGTVLISVVDSIRVQGHQGSTYATQKRRSRPERSGPCPPRFVLGLLIDVGQAVEQCTVLNPALFTSELVKLAFEIGELGVFE